MGKFYKIGFFVLLFLLIGGSAFYLGTNLNKPIVTPTPTVYSQPTEQPTQAAQTTPSPTTVVKKISTQDLIENIKAALTTKNTAALEGYMTDNVFVVLESTECCGQMTRTDAVKQLDYLKDATAPWNFDQSNETIKKLKATDPTDYGPESTIVGIAANEYVAAFKVNAENKITGITMAVTYKLVLP